jgi:hypothetical protein
MMRVAKFALLLFILIFSVFWIFNAEKFAIEKTNRYRVIANGWVSAHAYTHLSNDIKFIEKIKRTISEDFIHGRFRPAFFFYVTSSYALSPVVHGRSPSVEGRQYRDLANGDLRLFSFLLLATLSISLLAMSILVYKYTGETAYLIIPALFIPLSQTLTFNLLSGVIDSQEIPLILCLSLWTAAFFSAMRAKGRFLSSALFLFSLVFFLSAFLIKETVVSICAPLFILVLSAFLFSWNKPDGLEKRNFLFIVYTFVFSCICSIILVVIVMKHKKGYANGYSFDNYEQLEISAKALWVWMSAYSLHNIFGFLPILTSLYISVKNRERKICGMAAGYHFLLTVLLLFTSYSFLLILIPWSPLGFKYVLPSIFFFSFAVAFSLSFLTSWAKETYKKKGVFIYLCLILYVIIYVSYKEKSDKEKKYWAELGNYGASISDMIAENIDNDIKNNEKDKFIIFVDYGDNVSYGNPVTFGRLHLMRILNLDKKINIIKKNGEKILKFKMPVYELSSFIDLYDKKNVHISDSKKELEDYFFDIVYFGYKEKENPLQELQFDKNKACYRLTEGQIEYKSFSGFLPNFSLYKYIPCQGN